MAVGKRRRNSPQEGLKAGLAPAEMPDLFRQSALATGFPTRNLSN
jgi:hypothetical protein